MDDEGRFVLLVEDSETQALRFSTLLEEEGIGTHCSETAEDALDYLSHSRPDLIVVDYHLPRMRGDEFCRQIRMNPATSDILILILTDDIQGAVERQVLESGADDHVPKSVDPDGLMARINGLLRNKQRAGGAVLRAPSAYFHRHNVVVVDDSLTFLAYLTQELEHEGFDIITFSSGMEALAYLNQHKCDCMLVDLVMPGIDGIELCRRLDHFRSRTGLWFPLLMVTARDSKEDMMRALEAGADDFVGKSSDITILRARIRSLLRRKIQRDEHDRISTEFRNKELEVLRERTEREAAERRGALAEQLERTNRELKETQAQLIQAAKMASLGELVAGIAHEINNPLAYVMSHLDTVERTLDKMEDQARGRLSPAERRLFEKARVRLGDMRGGLERVHELVRKLRTFSRLDEGEFKRIDVRESIESVLAIVGHRIDDKITVEASYADDNVIWCFPAPLNQAVMNLLNNAIDAVEDGGRVEIRTLREAHVFHIVVTDDGAGLADGIRDRIFEPFFTTKPVGKGMGLGLAITYRIVQAHKGTIDARSREAGGTEFDVAIPLNLGGTPDGN